MRDATGVSDATGDPSGKMGGGVWDRISDKRLATETPVAFVRNLCNLGGYDGEDDMAKKDLVQELHADAGEGGMSCDSDGDAAACLAKGNPKARTAPTAYGMKDQSQAGSKFTGR